MTTGLQGADPAALDALAGELTEAANRLRLAQRVINGPLHAAPWFGSYAGLFRSKWDGQLTGSLFRSADFLDSAAGELRRQAEQQRRTSAADGRSGSIPPFTIEPCVPPVTKSDEEALRDFLLSLGLTIEQVNDLLKRFGSLLGKLNKLLENEGLADFLKTLGKVTDVLDVVVDFFDDFAEHSHLPVDEAIVHALGETAMRFVASEGGEWVGKALTTAIMSVIAPGPGTAASLAVGKVVGFIVDKVVEYGMDQLDGEFNIYDGAGDIALDAYQYAKERDFDPVRIAMDGFGDGIDAIGDGIRDTAENVKDGLGDAADTVRGWFD